MTLPRPIIIIGIMLLIEWSLYTLLLKSFGPVFHGFALIISGLLFSLFSWQAYLRITPYTYDIGYNGLEKSSAILNLPMIVYIILVILFGFYFVHVYTPFRIHKDESDVIVTLQLYIDRLLNSEPIYAPIDYGEWTVIPNYLPLQWLPYIIPHYLGMDYRLFSYLVFVMVYGWIVTDIRRYLNVLQQWIVVILPFLFIFFIGNKHASVFGHTTELVIASYYLILSYSIWKGKWWLLVLGISLCLLSRFSFIFWLPFLMYFVVSLYSWRFFWKIFFGVLIVACVVYVIPFMIDDPWVFFRGLEYYAHAAIGEWKPAKYQGIDEVPYHLQQGVGIALHIYQLESLDVYEKLKLMRSIQIVGCLLVTVISIILCKKNRNKYLNPFFALISLKVYFVVFYSTIHVPYLYLQITHLITSLFIYMALISLYKNKKHPSATYAVNN